MANSYGWPDPKVTYNKNAKKIDAARAARAAQVGQLHQPMPMAPVSPVIPPMGMGSLPLSMQPQTIATAQGKPWPPVQPPVPGFRGGGIVRFDDGGDVELSDEEKQRQAQMNAGNVPVPSTQGTYGPPAPTYLQAAQQVFAQNPELVSIAAGEMQANNGVTNIANAQSQQVTPPTPSIYQGADDYGTRVNGTPRQELLEQRQGASQYGGLAAAPMQLYDKLNPEIPYVTPAIENYVKPAVAFALNTTPLGAVKTLGGPDLGQLGASQIPSRGLDLALTAAPFAGEGINAARGAVTAGRGALETQALKGFEFKPQAAEALGGREAASAQLKGGLPAGAALTPQEGAALRAQAEAAGIKAEDWQSSTALLNQYGKTGADGAVARAKQALEAIGERTVGSPSEVLKRYDNAGAQIFPELGEAQHRINNMAGNAYQDAIAKGGSLEDAKAAAARAAAAQQEVEKGAKAANFQLEEDRLMAPFRQEPATSGVTPPSSTAIEITPHDAKVSRSVEPVPPNSDITVYRGSGRDNVQSVYSGNLKESHFQDATYYAFNPKDATTYGPNVEQSTIHLDKPLTITNDDQWRALTNQSGLFANPSLSPAAEQRAGFDKMKSLIESQGHDGIVIRLSDYGDDAKQLRNVFGHDQAIAFNKADINAIPDKLPTPAEMAGANNLTGDARVQAMEQVGNTAQSRELSPEAQTFLNSPAGQASAAQRTEAIGQGVTPGEVNAVGGTPPPVGTGGGTTGGTGGAGELKPQNPIQQAGNITSVATQIRLLGGHMFRQGEGAAVTHWKEAATAFRAGFDAFKSPGGASAARAEIAAKDALLPQGMQLKDVRGTTGPQLEKGYGDKFLSQIPLFDRIRGAGSAYLGALRDSLYVTTAQRHLAMDPGAPPAALKAIYNVESHVTGHPTLKGNVKEAMGNAQGVGVGWSALAARVQHFTDILGAPGSPLPWSPTAKGEAVRALLGNFGTMIASTGAASMLGAQVNVPFLGGQRDLTNPYGIRTDFFKPTTLTPDMAFKTVYGTGGSGYDAILRLFGNAAIDLANGDKGQLTTHVLNWARGEVGVAPSVLIDLLSGSTYNGKPYDLEALKQEASGGFLDRIAPIAAESMWNAYHAWGPEGLVRAAPSLGAWEVQTTPTTKTNQGNALLNGDNRDQLLGPTLAPLVKPGEDFNALGSREKEAIHAGMNPEALKAERDQKIKDGDKVAIAQFQREDIKSSYQPAFQKLEQEFKAGTYTPYEIRQLTNATERQMYEKMNGVKFPEPSKDYAPSPIQKAEEGYRSLYDALPKGANGKPDYDQLQHAQQAYMANIGKNDPELMQRLAANVLPRVNPNDSNIQKMYDQPEMKAAVKAYNSVDEGAKTGFRIENPQQNALLYSGGYVRTLDTPAAVEAFKAMGIAGEPQVNFAVGFTKDTATPYSRIQAGSLQPQLQQYQGLNASREEGDFRAQAYLQAHPALNALLWQTGHTSHVYSMDAYNAITQHHDPPLTGGRGNAVQAPAQPTGATLPPVVSNDTQQRLNFVQAMAGPAEQYAQATKIPPAVWAAMGASESNWGRAQSIFGIMGQGTAGGKNYDTFEIRPGGVKENTNSQFAAYNTLDDAFKHFTDLTSSGRYAPAWNNLQQTGDWQEFLHGINKAGYATAPNWADSIISLSKHIEDNYGLSR